MSTILQIDDLMLNAGDFECIRGATVLRHHAAAQKRVQSTFHTERFAGLVAFQKWWGYGTTEPCYALVLSRILAEFDRGAAIRLLDVGCGVGRLMYDCARLYDTSLMVGVDSDLDAVLFSHEVLCTTGKMEIDLQRFGVSDTLCVPRLGCSNVYLVHGDVLSCAFKPALFNVVAACSVLDRLSSVRRAIHLFSSWLAPGGIVIVLCPANLSTSAEWNEYGTLRLLEAMFDEAHLSVCESFEGVPMIQAIDGRRSSQMWDARFLVARKEPVE